MGRLGLRVPWPARWGKQKRRALELASLLEDREKSSYLVISTLIIIVNDYLNKCVLKLTAG